MGGKPLNIQWSGPAEARFEQLLTFIETENPDAARKLWARAMDAVERAARFPELAPSVLDVGRTYREIITVRPFRVVYRVEGRFLRIIAVLRQEQDFDPERFLD